MSKDINARVFTTVLYAKKALVKETSNSKNNV
jgi:hypothetical protein